MNTRKLVRRCWPTVRDGPHQLARAGVSFPALRNCGMLWPAHTGKGRTGEVRDGEIRAAEVRAEVRAAKIRAGEVDGPDVALGIPAPDHGKGSLNVGPCRSFPFLAAAN